MDSLTIRFVFDRKGITLKEPKKESLKKEALIQIEVYDKSSRKKKYISTGEYILRKQYSDVGPGGLSIVQHPNAAVIKARIDKIYYKVQAFIYSDKCQSLNHVDNWDKENDSLTMSVKDFIQEDMRAKKASLSAVEHADSFFARYDEFGKINTFKDITYANIEDLDAHLRKTITSQPVLYKRHNFFKKHIERAKRRGLIEYNPYDDFQVIKGRSDDPTFLMQDEVKKILEYIPKGQFAVSLDKVRDLFIFQCFTGLSYVDLEYFSKDNILVKDGWKEIHGNRIKTGVKYLGVFLPEAETIAEKYNYKLPVISNQKYNLYLRLMLDHVEITKKVTTHTARHTFGTFLINKKIPLDIVANILGHSSTKQSKLYARLLGDTVIDEMKEKLLK